MIKKISHSSKLGMGILSLLFLVGVGFFFTHTLTYTYAADVYGPPVPGATPAGTYGPPAPGDPAATPDPAADPAAATPAASPGVSCSNPGDIGCMAQQVFGKIIAVIINAFGKLLIAFMWLVLQVAQYNGFITSTAVTMGWAVIRDICNMFFVLFLLVIAIGTILQQQQYHYTKTLPKFLTNVLLINFSLTICGAIIDLAQVFMMTFFSAFADSGAGNFAVLLGIPTLMSASAGGQVNSFQTVTGLILALVYILVATVVVLLILIQLIVRIVALWFLVILSPFAFFLNTIPGLDAKGYVTKWWDSFTNFVVVGPALAFFLWLSLAVASGAAIGEDGKPVTDAKDAAKAVATKELLGGEKVSAEADKIWPKETAASDMSNPTSALSFLIGIGLLLGGLMTAQEIASGSSKFAGSAMKTGNDFVMGRRGPVKFAKDAAVSGGKFALSKAPGMLGRGAVGLAKAGVGAAARIPGMAALGALASGAVGVAAMQKKRENAQKNLESARAAGKPEAEVKKLEAKLKGVEKLEKAANLFASAAKKAPQLAKATAVGGGRMLAGGFGVAAAAMGGDFAGYMKKRGEKNAAHAQNFDNEQSHRGAEEEQRIASSAEGHPGEIRRRQEMPLTKEEKVDTINRRDENLRARGGGVMPAHSPPGMTDEEKTRITEEMRQRRNGQTGGDNVVSFQSGGFANRTRQREAA